MNIILVGGSGYLGNKLLIDMKKNGNNILCLIRKTTNINKINIHTDLYSYIEDNEFINKLNNFKADVLVYSACIYEKNNIEYQSILDANLLLPIKLLTELKNIKKYIYIGTSLEKYINTYTLTKRQMAEWGKYYSDIKNINFFNILLENFFGKDEPEDRFIHWIIKKLKNNEDIDLTDGKQKRDFIYIEDVVEALNLIINSNLKGYLDVPIGSGEAISIRELVEYLKKLLNSKSKLNFGATRIRNSRYSGVSDLSILTKIGFKLRYDIKSGLNKII